MFTQNQLRSFIHIIIQSGILRNKKSIEKKQKTLNKWREKKIEQVYNFNRRLGNYEM